MRRPTLKPARTALMLGATTLLSLSLSSQVIQRSPIDTLLDDAHYLRAHKLIEATLQKNPNDAQALAQRSVVEWAFSRFDASIASAEQAVSLAPASPTTNTQLTNALAAKLAASTGTFGSVTLARRFRKQAEHTLELDPNSVDAIDDLARFSWLAPAMVGGDRSKAHRLADHLTQVDPVRGAIVNASFCDETDKAKRDATVEALWKAAVAARPNSTDAHAGLADAYFAQGRAKYSLAESEDRRAISLDPTRIVPYRQLAILYATTARWDDLDKLLRQSRAAVPDDLSPDYEAARVILISNSAAHLTVAELYLRTYLGQPAEGQEPTHAQAHWRLGLILEKQGRKADTIQELKTAIQLDNSLDAAKKDLQRLT